MDEIGLEFKKRNQERKDKKATPKNDVTRKH